MVLGVWRRVASVWIQLTVNELLDTASTAARRGREEVVAVKVTCMKAVCLSRIWSNEGHFYTPWYNRHPGFCFNGCKEGYRESSCSEGNLCEGRLFIKDMTQQSP